jgi:hypothetical protein
MFDSAPLMDEPPDYERQFLGEQIPEKNSPMVSDNHRHYRIFLIRMKNK